MIFIHEGEKGAAYYFKSGSKRRAAYGLRLYSDKRKVKTLIGEGERSKKAADRTMTGRILSSLPQKTDAEIKMILIRHFNGMADVFRVYRKSEVFYTEGVDKTVKNFLKKTTADPVEANRLYALILTPTGDSKVKNRQKEALDKMKAPERIRTLCESVRSLGKARLVLHEPLNGDFFLMKAVLAEIAKRKHLEPRQLEVCRIEDIFALLDGKTPDPAEINRRKEAYVAFCRGKKPCFYSGGKARKLIAEIMNATPENIKKISGNPASAGKVTGRVIIMPGFFSNKGKDFRKQMKMMKKGDILVANNTGPEMIMACRLAGAIVANEGGINSHAAIVSRELGIPAIVGTKIATHVLHDGDLVEVDANAGIVKILG